MRLFLGLLLLLLFPYGLSAQNFMGILEDSYKKKSPFVGYNSALSSEKEEVFKEASLHPQLLLSDASFILAQATLCPDWKDLEELQKKGLQAWIDKQIHIPPSYVSDKVQKWEMVSDELIEKHSTQGSLAFQLGKWHHILRAKDQLRQRMAWALDEILQKPQSLDSFGFSPFDQGRYYDLLITHALGNYQDLLREIAVDSRLGVILKNHGIDREVHQGPEEAVDQLFYHPHTGFQLADGLIKELLDKVPSQGFVQRVAKVFEENEQGQRGDLGAMISAIYLDPETHLFANYDIQLDRALLLEPMLKYRFMCEAIDEISMEELSSYLQEENKVLEEGEAAFLETSDLFSFFIPFNESFEPSNSDFSQTHNSALIINFIKEVQRQTLSHKTFAEENTGFEEEVSDDLNEIFELAEHPHELLEYLDILFVQGLLSEDSKSLIEESIREISYPEDRFSVALYLIFISPDYRNLL